MAAPMQKPKRSNASLLHGMVSLLALFGLGLCESVGDDHGLEGLRKYVADRVMKAAMY